MKKLINNIALMACLSLLVLACNEDYDRFIEPKAEMELDKATVNILEPLYITNLGAGETFAFWPGDENHDYSLSSTSKNTGLPSNRGNDFEYYYKRSGTYTITLVASSYDENTGKFVQQIISKQITVNPGNNGNNFTMFAIDNALSGYSPEGIIEGNNITIPLGFLNRPAGISDADYVDLINRRRPLFRVNSSSALVYSQENTLLKGNGDDVYELNLIDATTLEPIIKTFTVVQDGVSNEYSVAALFYPEISDLNIAGFPAIKYSKDGFASVPEDEIKEQQLAYPNQSFYGAFIVGMSPEGLASTILNFSLFDGARLYLKETGEEIISGTTPVDISNPPVQFKINRTINGFSIESEFELYTTVF